MNRRKYDSLINPYLSYAIRCYDIQNAVLLLGEKPTSREIGKVWEMLDKLQHDLRQTANEEYPYNKLKESES